MKEFIINILKGMVVGLANIIPGVSRGTMMVSMGIYDRLIMLLTHFIKKFKEAMKLLIPLVIGMLLAIALLSKVITKMFEAIPLQTTLLFVGMIIGGLPVIFKKVKGKKVGIAQIIGFAVFFVLVIGLSLVGEDDSRTADVTLNLVNIVKLFLAGALAAGTMVIPGVSGSMVMMIIGYYTVIIGTISGLIDALHPFDWAGILSACGVLVPFGIGVLVGVVVIAKLIEYVLRKYSLTAYWSIIGLIVASPFAILIMMGSVTINVVNILTGVVMLAVGFFIAMKLGGE